MAQFTYRRCETEPKLPNVGMVDGTVYAIMSNSIPMGWVAKAGKEWLAWNAYGDFWHRFGTTRDDATARMLDDGWQHFTRR